MLDEKLNIALVKYTNTLPYLKALKNLSHYFNVVKASPAECVELFKSGHSKLALIPVAALNEIGAYRVISEYGIACNGPVHTVKILSKIDINEVNSIVCDKDSRSSVALSKILFEEFWKVDIDCITGDVSLGNHDTILAIGDKVFELEASYKYHYDLGEVWKKMTGLPFVFAVWVLKTDLPLEIDKSLLNSFRELDKIIKTVIEDSKDSIPWIANYLRNNLDYKLTSEHVLGMESYLAKLHQRASLGIMS